MSEETIDSDADATAGNTPPADAVPPSDNTPPPADADTPPAEDTPKDTPKDTPPADTEFSIPDEHKGKPWASKVKSEADLYKQLDNLTSVAGKKNAYPSADATPEELTEYYQGLRPESADKYQFSENITPETSKVFGDMLYKANISDHQAKELVPAYEAWQKDIVAESTSEEGFTSIMTEKFGKDFDGVVASVSKSMEKHVSKETQDVLNSMPNQYLGAMYEYGNNLLKAHGVKEGGDNIHSYQGGVPTDSLSFEQKRDAITKELHKLVQGPHTAEQKQALINQRQDLYKQRLTEQKGTN